MKLPSTVPKRDRNHTAIVDMSMIEPAFLMNDQPRSHIERRTLLSVGIWYAGSSITKGAGSPENIVVFFSMMPETIIAAMPMK